MKGSASQFSKSQYHTAEDPENKEEKCPSLPIRKEDLQITYSSNPIAISKFLLSPPSSQPLLVRKLSAKGLLTWQNVRLTLEHH